MKENKGLSASLPWGLNFGVPGKDGATFTPSLDDEGNLSWSNDKGLQNPETKNIRGPEGPAGEVSDDKIAEAVKEYLDSGGNADYVSVEPADDDIPKVFITGQIPTTKDDINCFMQYRSKTESFDAYIKIKCQGSSSMGYPKKNYTVKLYSDEERETKLEKNFRDWGLSINKFVLKVNWIDHSHARNVVSANLWSEVVESRKDYATLPAEMRNSPRNGAIDGFPVKVYTNGTYQGLYTWNISKDAWMWGMDEDNANHALLCAETNTNGVYAENACNFRKLYSESGGWEIEVGQSSTALTTAMDNLISCVMNASDADFKAQIVKYLDIQSAIDYYIFAYVDCGLDSLARNMLLATYDMKKWYAGQYDIDSTWGLYYNGSKFVSPEYRCPEDYQEQFSLLWERIEALYVDEIKARYAELRSGVLSFANIATKFERFAEPIGSDLYAEDLIPYPGVPQGSSNGIRQIRDFARDRLVYVDAQIEALTVPVPCTGITLSASSLTFADSTTKTLIATVTPENTTNMVEWSSDNEAVATVENGVITPIASGDAVITAKCGDYSASCSVTVALAGEVQIPCTGISLSASELTFEGLGSKTLTATVTPENTTDNVVWSTNNDSVATVNNGVVKPVGNGNAVITVTCGEQSASCTVTVSGVVSIDYTLNPLDGIEWEAGYTYVNGVKTAKSGENCTPKFEVQPCTYMLSGGQYSAVYVWDENDNYVATNQGEIYFTFPAGYKAALKSYGAEFDPTAVSFMPVDYSETAVYTEIPLAGLTWNVKANTLEASLSGVAYTDIDNCDHAVIWSVGYAGATVHGESITFALYKNNNNFTAVAVGGFGTDTAAAAEYFNSNDFKLVLNPRQKP